MCTPGPGMSKSMSEKGFAFALTIAARSDPLPESLVLTTVKTMEPAVSGRTAASRWAAKMEVRRSSTMSPYCSPKVLTTKTAICPRVAGSAGQ